MPQFTNDPPEDSNRHSFRLIRTPAAGTLRAYVLSPDLIGCPTHFVGNRTVPCERPYCSPCNAGISWRWHGYLFVLTDPQNEQAIFEFTATSAEVFTRYRQQHGTLRACHFQSSRVNQKPNGRVLIQTKPADLNRIALPEPRDLIKLLSHIWNIPPNQTQKTSHMPKPPHPNLEVDRTRPEIPAETVLLRDALEQAIQHEREGANHRPTE